MNRPAEFQVPTAADDQIVQTALLLLDGEQVRKGLGGVVVAAVPGVDHRHRRLVGRHQRSALLGVAHGDDVRKAAHRPGGIRHALPLHGRRALGLGKAQNLSAQLVHGRLKAQAGPGGGFVKEGGQLFAAALLPVLPPLTGSPLVSIIVPAYNEEVNAVGSLHNLLRCDYPNFNLIFVDDGSGDHTFDQVNEAFKNHPLVKVFSKPNGGKASALNFGISHTDAEYVVCIDADTKLLPNAVSLMMRHFADEDAGAVAGNVKVGNEVNILTHWQSIEYISSQNIDRNAFAYFNGITVVPGAIGAFRKQAIEDAGGFTTDTLAEDCDLTIRILRCGYNIKNENKAIAYTEAPETLKQFMKQRFRWTFGVMQTFWKNRDALFNFKTGRVGWIVLPDMLLFKYIVPFLTPIADLLMLIGLLTGNIAQIGAYYLLFLLVDLVIAMVSFRYERENMLKLVSLIPQRIIYRWLMLIVLLRAFKRAIQGELQHWGVLKRTGNVKEVMTVN